MVSTNYSSCFQPIPSQEVGLVPYVEPLLTPTIDEHVFPYAEYIAEDERGPYRVNVNVLQCSGGLMIEHVANGNLLMRVKIISKQLLISDTFHYYKILDKYQDWRSEKLDIEIKQLKIEHEKIMARFKKSLAKANEKDMLDKAILMLGGVVVNSAITTKNITQSALIATRDTIAKTSAVAKENIAALVFFCSYALVKFPSSRDIGRNYRTEWYMGSRKPIPFNFQSILERQKRDSMFKTSQDTSYSHSSIAQLLYKKKKI